MKPVMYEPGLSSGTSDLKRMGQTGGDELPLMFICYQPNMSSASIKLLTPIC